MKHLYLPFFILVIITALLIFNVAITAFPYSPIKYSYRARMNFLSVLPEGWAFFTKNAREPALTVYAKGFNGFKLADLPGGSPCYAFGFNRKGRARTAELESLIDQIPETAWQHDSVALFRVQSAMSKEYDVFDKVSDYSYNGEILVVKKEPVPWAWSRLTPEPDQPFDYVFLKVHHDAISR